MKKTIFFYLLASLILVQGAAAQKKARLGRVCGDPAAACRVRDQFQPYELPFDTGRNAVIAESEYFYAVIVKSVKLADDNNCDKAISDKDITDTQALFPHSKVFALKCFEPAMNYYTNVADNTAFRAVFAGRTKAAANAFLKTLKTKGKYGDAVLRRMQAGINGT